MVRATKRLDQPFTTYHSAKNIPEDVELTHVGSGTPGGEYLWRFWQPLDRRASWYEDKVRELQT